MGHGVAGLTDYLPIFLDHHTVNRAATVPELGSRTLQCKSHEALMVQRFQLRSLRHRLVRRPAISLLLDSHPGVLDHLSPLLVFSLERSRKLGWRVPNGLRTLRRKLPLQYVLLQDFGNVTI